MGLDPAGFVDLGLHGAAMRDDGCGFAGALREELLTYPHWKPMRLGYDGFQTAITTGHIQGRFPELKNCHVWSALLAMAGAKLCARVGADPSPPLSVDMQAMAYGQGGGLRPHTDSIDRRRLAWILYLTHPDDGAWRAADGGALQLSDRQGQRVEVYPSFNRLIIFRVSDDAWHEITPVRRATPWDRARLALSGWLNGRVPTSA